jgi:hypothetical protein
MDALPLAPRADLGYHTKLAAELLAAGDNAAALHAWAARWLDDLACAGIAARPPGQPDGFGSDPASLVGRVRDDLPRSLAAAQEIVARFHGFTAWSAFIAFVRDLGDAATAAARFEAAADAVVGGTRAILADLLRADASIVRTTSARRHRSTLLHYVAANGVEEFRQRTPPKIVEIARLLLDAGAEVDAPNDEHGRGTALGLVATSAHARQAGVQIALMELLVGAGAAIDGLPGGWQPMSSALSNGCPEAAAWLAERGAQVTFTSAAGIGRVDMLEAAFGSATLPRTDEIRQAFRLACSHGRTAAAAFLLDRGAELAPTDGHQTGLHLAAAGAHLETVRLLLARGALLEVKNQYGGTVLDQALWSAVRGDPATDYLPIIEALIAGGAYVDPTWSTGIERIDAALRRAVATP